MEPLGTRRLGPSTLLELRKRARSAEVIVAHGSTTLPASVLATLGMSTPMIYRTIGDISQWNTARWRARRTQLLLRRPTAVVCLSDAASEGLTALGVARRKIWTIPNGVPERDFPGVDGAQRAAARARLGIRAEALAAFVGALEPEKDPATAVRAVAPIRGLHLVVAGDGSLRRVVEELAERIAPGRVHFLGHVANSAPVLAAADVLVLTSLTEGSPAAAIEAGLTGIPVVGSEVGFVSDIVLDGITGFLVQPGDSSGFTAAINSALSRAAALGLSARAHCERTFVMSRVGASWRDLLSHYLAAS